MGVGWVELIIMASLKIRSNEYRKEFDKNNTRSGVLVLDIKSDKYRGKVRNKMNSVVLNMRK